MEDGKERKLSRGGSLQRHPSGTPKRLRGPLQIYYRFAELTLIPPR